MKKILFVALAATLLAAGCQKTEIINHVGDTMTFSTEIGKLTKSVDEADAFNDGMQNLLAQDFYVWAYYVEADANTGAAANANYDGMSNKLVQAPGTVLKDGSTLSGWTPDKDYYWPGKGKDLKFFAVSGVNDATVSESENKVTIKDFTVAPTDANVDLMVADFVQQSQEDNNKEVALKFNHALTKVEFLFQTTTSTKETIYVQRLEVGKIGTDNKITGGLINKGTLDVTTSTTDFGTKNSETKIDAVLNLTNDSWSSTNSSEVQFVDDYDIVDSDFPESYTPAGGADATDAIPEGERNQAMKLDAEGDPDVFTTWLMIPQSVDGDEVTITYLIDDRQFKANFKLDGVDQKKWMVNQYVKYIVTLAPNKISFSAEVKDWSESEIDLGDEEDTIVPEPSKTIEYTVTKIGDTEAQEGSKISVTQKGDTIAVNDTTTAEDGIYTLEDGTVVTIANKIVTAVS